MLALYGASCIVHLNVHYLLVVYFTLAFDQCTVFADCFCCYAVLLMHSTNCSADVFS